MGRSARLAKVLGPLVAGLAVLTLAGWSLLSAENERGPPPLSGWMQNFTMAEAPIKAPTARFVGQDGTSYTLDDFRGKVVLVNFWATWCAPCIREMPSLVRLQAKLAGEAFGVLALSQDRGGWTKIAPFLVSHDLQTLPTFYDPRGAFARDAKARGLPTTVLYDREGTEIGRLAGIAEWDSAEAIALIQHFISR